MRIEEAIENLYSVFSKYTTSDMHYCDCGCIDVQDVKKLASKKLRELEEDDFCSYHGSALYTWGEIEHYKHFIPRIYEVHRQKNGRGLIGLFEITSKLEYAKWNSWDEKEIAAIQEFILADWLCFIESENAEIRSNDLEYYTFFYELGDIFKAWKLTENDHRLKNFVEFFYYHGNEIVNKGLKLNGKVFEKDFRDLIKQDGLLEGLENAFFKANEVDPKYAEKVSIVLQMVEQSFS